MAKIKTVITVEVEDNLVEYDSLCSFETKNYFGEWISSQQGYAIFQKSDEMRVAEMIKIISRPESLEELVFQVKRVTTEDIIEIYDEYITTVNINIPKYLTPDEFLEWLDKKH